MKEFRSIFIPIFKNFSEVKAFEIPRSQVSSKCKDISMEDKVTKTQFSHQRSRNSSNENKYLQKATQF